MNTVPAQGRLSASLDLPDSLRAPAVARRWVPQTLACWGVSPSDEASALLVELTSELVTNAVLHAAPCADGARGLSIRVVTGAGTIRIEVHDPDPTPPRLREPDWVAENGRGLFLVDAQADRWGAVPYEDGRGKYVWFSVGSHEDTATTPPSPAEPTTTREPAPAASAMIIAESVPASNGPVPPPSAPALPAPPSAPALPAAAPAPALSAPAPVPAICAPRPPAAGPALAITAPAPSPPAPALPPPAHVPEICAPRLSAIGPAPTHSEPAAAPAAQISHHAQPIPEPVSARSEPPHASVPSSPQ